MKNSKLFKVVLVATALVVLSVLTMSQRVFADGLLDRQDSISWTGSPQQPFVKLSKLRPFVNVGEEITVKIEWVDRNMRPAAPPEGIGFAFASSDPDILRPIDKSGLRWKTIKPGRVFLFYTVWCKSWKKNDRDPEFAWAGSTRIIVK